MQGCLLFYGWAVLLQILFTQAVAPMWRFSLHEKLSENLNVLKALSNERTHTLAAFGAIQLQDSKR